MQRLVGKQKLRSKLRVVAEGVVNSKPVSWMMSLGDLLLSPACTAGGVRPRAGGVCGFAQLHFSRR
jgi:hypothetical protein